MLKNGLFEQGSQFVKDGAMADEKIALTDKAKAETSLKQTEGKLKEIEFFSSTVANTHSQEDYNKAVQQYEQLSGKPAPPQFKNATWSPEFKTQLEQMGTTWKDRHTAALEDQKLSIDQANKASEAKLREVQMVKEQAQTKEITVREARLAKNEGNGFTKPDKTLLGTSSSMIKADFPDISSTQLANTAAYVTSQAQMAIKNNKALDWETALHQEYSKVKKDLKVDSHFFGKDDVKFNRPENKDDGIPPGWTIKEH
jgi:hypothetical protein